jgi:glycosyltransferase involved in cell wall biosynthesis
MSNIILPNVTLAAIVRDERINPAGGIKDFLHSTLPFVEEAVLVDTGSMDGTREILEVAKKSYPHLTILNHEFHGFAEARNYSLAQVKTPFVLVLDSDERLGMEDFDRLKKYMKDNKESEGFQITISDIYSQYQKVFMILPRLFRSDKGFHYKNSLTNLAEFLEGFKSDRLIVTDVKIKHFKPNSAGIKHKNCVWYNLVNTAETIPAPSITEGFSDWKKLNPQRLHYHFGLPGYRFKVPE